MTDLIALSLGLIVRFLNPILLNRRFELSLMLIENPPSSSEIVQFLSSDSDFNSSIITYEIFSPDVSFTIPVKVCPRRFVMNITNNIYDFAKKFY